MNETLKKLIRPHFLDLKGYISAGMESDKTADLIFLNANENPYSLPGLEGMNRYPEPQPKTLLEAYARLYNVSADSIVATRGADESITLLTKLFCEPHKDKAVISPPTFAMYEVNLRAIPALPVAVPLIKDDSGFHLNVEAIIEKAQEPDTKLVFLCSPNNPTANSFARADIIRILDETAGHVAVVIDETYIEFAGAQSFSGDLAHYPHMIILRTLSKSYALAGARMGCMMAHDTDVIKLIRNKLLDIYPLPHGSVNAALEALTEENLAYAQKSRQKLLAERERVAAALERHAGIIRVYPSDANFLLVEMEDAGAFVTYAAQQGVIVRDFSSKPETENCIRLSIGLPQENNKVLALLKEFTEG